MSVRSGEVSEALPLPFPLLRKSPPGLRNLFVCVVWYGVVYGVLFCGVVRLWMLLESRIA